MWHERGSGGWQFSVVRQHVGHGLVGIHLVKAFSTCSDVFDLCSEHVPFKQNTFGTQKKHARNMLGTCWKHDWNMIKTRPEHEWNMMYSNMTRTLLEHVWNMTEHEWNMKLSNWNMHFALSCSRPSEHDGTWRNMMSCSKHDGTWLEHDGTWGALARWEYVLLYKRHWLLYKSPHKTYIRDSYIRVSYIRVQSLLYNSTCLQYKTDIRDSYIRVSYISLM